MAELAEEEQAFLRRARPSSASAAIIFNLHPHQLSRGEKRREGGGSGEIGKQGGEK